MQKIASKTNILSLPLLLRAAKPKLAIEQNLVQLLTVRLKELRMAWNPAAFRGGLMNPRLPVWLLEKLESLITLAETSDWRLSKSLASELDNTIEDIETFDPPFQAALRQASRDVKAGRFVTQEVLEQRYRIRKPSTIMMKGDAVRII
ncbi:hypothetical protein A2755_00010 [Candidatus Wolfebacteria bacterium RIFCSPHIGHO2_01_FULL_48_22]|uniref:Uncharacterized protein n=1 Tax=Candidatus Wolfebacteria bacterium RIFCSPHIGHO2_01_FULL_48_22 TaxID=1802555 RepID=A0A1F8DR46_9BACT|nr:MAG: hypothetical protein A2755_00010 [Candidatus Wolfebacteria bacterium RIFCSPHIGHO2_01_FULL_48_22]